MKVMNARTPSAAQCLPDVRVQADERVSPYTAGSVALSVGAVTSRKRCALQWMTPLRAAAVMDAMDYDVHLFADTETGEDAVVYRGGPCGLRLARQRRMTPPAGLASRPAPMVVNPRPAPMLTEAAAVKRLCDARLRFEFFCDPVSGRGRLLYPRYDGSIGSITSHGRECGSPHEEPAAA